MKNRGKNNGRTVRKEPSSSPRGNSRDIPGSPGKLGVAPISKSMRLLSTWVPIEVYDEVSRRAASERRSLSQFLALFLEKSFVVNQGHGNNPVRIHPEE